jgi:biopolymer transport protein ExbD
MTGGSGGGGGGGSRSGVKRRKKQHGSGELMIASMLDILMAVLFFLLKNYSTVVTDFSVGKDISLPYSSSLAPPTPSLQMVVTQQAVILDDKEIAPIVNGDIPKQFLHGDGLTITKLFQELRAQKEKTEYIQKKSDEQNSFTGTIVMQADKNLNFNVLKKVIYTAGVSDFVMLKLAALKKDNG